MTEIKCHEVALPTEHIWPKYTLERGSLELGIKNGIEPAMAQHDIKPDNLIWISRTHQVKRKNFLWVPPQKDPLKYHLAPRTVALSYVLCFISWNTTNSTPSTSLSVQTSPGFLERAAYMKIDSLGIYAQSAFHNLTPILIPKSLIFNKRNYLFFSLVLKWDDGDL